MILDDIKTILSTVISDSIKISYMPDKPDTVVGVFNYSGERPQHSFGGTDFSEMVQIRSRALDDAKAYTNITLAANRLNHYADTAINVVQMTPILDIGVDNANPQRQEYTANFKITWI